jgi:hypothetical protein
MQKGVPSDAVLPRSFYMKELFMKVFLLVLSSIFAVLVMPTSIRASDDIRIERLTTCQDSWLEWKNNPSKLKDFSKYINSAFVEKENSSFLVPTSEKSVFGLRVVQLFPESIGMAVGFSVVVEADFKTTRDTLEKRLGKSFKKCETGENMLTCELGIGEKKTILLLSEEDGKIVKTLFGCFYYYEK